MRKLIIRYLQLQLERTMNVSTFSIFWYLFLFFRGIFLAHLNEWIVE